MEAWLQSIGPEVIDQWLMFARVEPEAFGLRPRGRGDTGGSGTVAQMIPASKAADFFAKRYGS